MQPVVAYLAQGKLYTSTGTDKPLLIESPFAQAIQDRAERTAQRQGWKFKGNGPLPGGMLWNFRGGPGGGMPGVRQVAISSISRANAAGQVMYVLHIDQVSGLFSYDTASRDERRLVHRKDFVAQDISIHEGGDIVCSVGIESGAMNLAVMEPDGGNLREITEGDSLDQAPSWVPATSSSQAASGRRILYQSSGIGRNHAGFMVAQGPYAIHMIDLESDHFETLAEDEATDFLLPRMTTGGDLYFIRRPYSPRGWRRASPLRIAGDVALFPFRVVKSVFDFLNAFATAFSGKPLTTAGGPKIEGPEWSNLFLWGSVIDAKRIARTLGKNPDAGLVPKDWVLIKRSSGGEESTVATAVLGYDLESDGTVVYTNGTTVYRVDGKGGKERVCGGRMIERVVALR